MHSSRALSFYLEELHALGGELSLDDGAVKVSGDLRALADRSPDRSPHRTREPYRRAISGIYARLAATGPLLDQLAPIRRAVGEAPPYETAEELRVDLDVVDRSLVANGSELLARGRLRSLRRAVDVFGLHLADLDLRQNSDVHEKTIAELFNAAGVGIEYSSLNEEMKVDLLRKELGSARPLASPFVNYSTQSRSEIAILNAAKEAHRLYGKGSIPNYVISMTHGVSIFLKRRFCSMKAASCVRRQPNSTSISSRCLRRSRISADAELLWIGFLRFRNTGALSPVGASLPSLSPPCI